MLPLVRLLTRAALLDAPFFFFGFALSWQAGVEPSQMLPGARRRVTPGPRPVAERREALITAINQQEGHRHTLRLLSPLEAEDENQT